MRRRQGTLVLAAAGLLLGFAGLAWAAAAPANTRPASLMQPQASVMRPAVAPSAESRVHWLWPAGEANAIDQIYPVADGRILILDSGQRFFLPDSVPAPGLEEGQYVYGGFRRVNGQKVLTVLFTDSSEGSHFDSGD